jgi:DNA-binding CsgD family transcriptional regulator
MRDTFTPQEERVCKLLMLAKTNGEIAQELKITDRTVRFHTTNIYKILNVKNRTDFIFAYLKRQGKTIA